MKKFVDGMDEGAKVSGLGGLILDLQPRFLQSIEKQEQLVDSAKTFAAAMGFLDIPLCITEQAPEKMGQTEEGLLEVCRKAERFSKNTFSAFGCEEFENWLAENETTHLLLAGIETPICVYLTAVDAIRKKMEVTVLTDCVGGRRGKDGEWALRKLERIGCHLLPLESLLYAMLGSTLHEEFRSISGLVRDRIP